MSLPITTAEEIKVALAKFRCTEPTEQYEVFKHSKYLGYVELRAVPDPAHKQNLLLVVTENAVDGFNHQRYSPINFSRVTLDSDNICKQLHKLALYTAVDSIVAIAPDSHVITQE